jgi:hypothetical protein
MTLSDLTSALDAAGVKLGLRLVVDAPEGALTDDLRLALKDHRDLLLAHLAGPPPELAPPPSLHWRETVARWPVPLRQRWADAAERFQAEGKGWREAEWSAYLDAMTHIHEHEATAPEHDSLDPSPFPAFDSLPGSADLERAKDANTELRPGRHKSRGHR